MNREGITGRAKSKGGTSPCCHWARKVEDWEVKTIKMSKILTHNEHERNGRRNDSDKKRRDELSFVTENQILFDLLLSRVAGSFNIILAAHHPASWTTWWEGVWVARTVKRPCEIKCEQHFRWKVHKFELCKKKNVRNYWSEMSLLAEVLWRKLNQVGLLHNNDKEVGTSTHVHDTARSD